MKGKAQERHPYFWLFGAGGPGNYRKRTAKQEHERKMLIHLKNKANGMGLPFNLSLGDVHIPDYCPVFGFKFVKGNTKGTKHGGNSKSPSVDRIIPSKGYVKGNVVVVSLKANTIKETASLSQMEKRLEKLKEAVSDLDKVVRFYRKINR
jgi:hypothetical protein